MNICRVLEQCQSPRLGENPTWPGDSPHSMSVFKASSTAYTENSAKTRDTWEGSLKLWYPNPCDSQNHLGRAEISLVLPQTNLFRLKEWGTHVFKVTLHVSHNGHIQGLLVQATLICLINNNNNYYLPIIQILESSKTATKSGSWTLP